MRYRLTKPMEKFWITLHFKNDRGEKIFSTSGAGRCYEQRHDIGEYKQIAIIPANFFNWGSYAIDFMCFNQMNNIEVLVVEGDIMNFSLTNCAIEMGGYMCKEPGDITPKFDYVERKLK